MDRTPANARARKASSKRLPSLSSTSSQPTGLPKAAAVKRLSTDPRSVAARERRHRISDRLKTLRSMVPGSHKVDTASMLDGAIRYVKFLQAQIHLHYQISIFLAGLQFPDSGHEFDYWHDDRHGCYDYYPMTTETSFSGASDAELVDSQSAPNTASRWLFRDNRGFSA